MTLTGTRVPQDVLTDTSTTLRLPQTGTKNTETEWQSQTKDQTTLCDLDMEKVTKTKWPRTEIRKMEEKKMEKVFYLFRCRNLDQTYTFICCARLPNQE